MAKRKITTKGNSSHRETSSSTQPALPVMGTEDVFQWSKYGFDSTVKMSNAIIEGFEHIREMQMHSAHEAHEKNDKIARDLMQARSSTDLAQLQMEFARFNLERAQRYWQQMFTIANQMNAKLVEEVKNECLVAGEKLSQTLGQAKKAIDTPKAVAPEPLRAAMDMTNMTLTNFTKAASQWMDTAKNNLENIAATRH
jgi:F0F1-type ATP synthase membrane subunit b/b'